MTEISLVPGITGSTLELFRDAGLDRVEKLISLSAQEVLVAFDAANVRYNVAVRRPSEELVGAWQNAGRAILRTHAEGQAPAAKMVPAENLRAAGIDVSSVPLAKVVDPPPPSAESRGTGKEVALAESKSARPAARQSAAPSRQESPPQKAPQAAPKPKPKEPVEQAKRSPAPNVRFKQLDVVKNSRNQGQRRNRGMSHPEAGRVRWAATVTVMAPLIAVLNALALVSALLMLRFYGWEFHWTLALLLLIFPFCMMMYFSQGAKVRCRLCGQNLFVPKRCRKHGFASRSIFGHTFAVARNAMLFAHYRCMLCGTKTRLKD
jgi:hypothetical protein